ncbi:MAG: hypothetical protein ACYDGM_09660 [Vulcanimicrobiaceae bacterium]
MRHDTSLPDSLAHPRPIRSWDDVSSDFGDTFFLVGAPQSDLDTIAVDAGLRGAFIQRGQAIPATVVEYLPQVLRTTTPLLGDMIPATSFGSSLANLLVHSCWEEIRQAYFLSHGATCSMCGARGRLEVHELWTYFEPEGAAPLADGYIRYGVQRLERLIGVCDRCHATHHLGKAKIDGRLDATLKRLAGINRWDTKDTADYYTFVSARWKRRNTFGWILDARSVAFEPFVVSETWKIEENDPRFVTRETKKGASTTALVESRWCFARERETLRNGVPQEEAYSDD